jgi:uridine kinase
LDTAEEICLQWKIKRDYEKYKIYPTRTAIMWEDMSQPMFERFVKNQKEKADIIVKTDKCGKMSLKKNG